MTDEGAERGAGDDAGERRVGYWLLPPDLAPKLHDLLRRHFRDDPAVEVIVERRRGERRATDERRKAPGEAPEAEERRAIRSVAGRRIGERRAALVPAEAPELPRRARRYADRLAFVERLEPSTEQLEDRDTARVVTRVQAGDHEEFATLYTRYFDRVYAYLRVALRNTDEAEDAAQQVFAEILEALPRYERRAQPFRSWLFTVVRNTAIKELRRERRLELPGEEALARHAERAGDAPEIEELISFDWLGDRDLLLFVERLPIAQRQVLVLRFMLGLDTAEIAKLLDRSPQTVRAQQSRALRFLRERLTAIGRNPRGGDPKRSDRIPTLVPIRQLRVIRERRFGLISPGPS